jgi:hypothetical protein
MQGELRNQHADELELQITQALERLPEMAIPADFAARVAAQLPKRRAVMMPCLQTRRTGQSIAAACLVALLGAMLLLAPRATLHSTFWTAMEWTLCAQFVVLAMWLGVWRRQVE